jgi:hypothetical protein
MELLKIEEKNKQLALENNQLIDRWIKHKNEEAEQMNDYTAIFNQLVDAKKQIEILKKMKESPIPGDSNLLDKLSAGKEEIQVAVKIPKKALRSIVNCHLITTFH